MSESQRPARQKCYPCLRNETRPMWSGIDPLKAGWRRSADRTSLWPQFPANREFNREFHHKGPFPETCVSDTRNSSALTAEFPRRQTGNFRRRTAKGKNSISDWAAHVTRSRLERYEGNRRKPHRRAICSSPGIRASLIHFGRRLSGKEKQVRP
jgi:hypothetical protein